MKNKNKELKLSPKIEKLFKATFALKVFLIVQFVSFEIFLIGLLFFLPLDNVYYSMFLAALAIMIIALGFIFFSWHKIIWLVKSD